MHDACSPAPCKALERIERQISLHMPTILSQVADPAAECRWLSSQWLTKWADSVEPPAPIDNAPLLCSHNKLDPTKTAGEPS